MKRSQFYVLLIVLALAFLLGAMSLHPGVSIHSTETVPVGQDEIIELNNV